MDSKLAISSAAERERVDELRDLLIRLSERLADKEMEFARMRGKLARFQNREFRTVGRLYAELDELRARIAEKRAARRPDEELLASEARRRRSRAERSAREYRHWAQEEKPDPPSHPPPSESAKKLYRKIAADLHPDLAQDEEAREVRTRLMAELNDAYAQGDIQRMRDILDAWERSPESIPGKNPADDLQRLERTIDRMRRKIESVEAEIRRLKSTSLYSLMIRTHEASSRGRDLMAELVEEITRKIASAREELADLQEETI